MWGWSERVFFACLSLSAVGADAAPLGRGALLVALALPGCGLGAGASARCRFVTLVGGGLGGLARVQFGAGERWVVAHRAQEPPEQQPTVAGASSVEPEHELVEVRVEVVRFDRTLMGAEQPSLEECGDSMDMGEHDMRVVGLRG